MNCHDAIEGLLRDGFDGASSGGASRAIEAHLKVCADCRETWASLQDVHGTLRAIPPPEPSKSLAARAFAASIEAKRAGERSLEDLFFRWGLRACVAACAAAVVLLLAAAPWESTTQDLTDWESEQARLSEEILSISVQEASSG